MSGDGSAPYSGLFPKKGWGRRNLVYWRERVAPEVLRRRSGATRDIDFGEWEDLSLRLVWVGHASFVIQFAGFLLMVDPNWARWHGPVKRLREPGLELNRMPRLDAIFVTHAHFDHLHRPSLRVLESREGVVVPNGNGSLVKRLGFHAIHEMKVWEERLFDGGLRVTHTPSLHWGARYLHDTHREYGGYLFEWGGKTVFHCGDSAWFDGFADIRQRLPRIDVAILPIGAYGAPSGRDVHMNPEEALRAFVELDAQYMIPMHYGTFPLGTEPVAEPVTRLMQEAARQDLLDRVIIPEEGVAMEFTADGFFSEN